MVTNTNVKYSVRLLSEADVNQPWFLESTLEYKLKIALLQNRMGEHYPKMTEMIVRLLNHQGAERQIRRLRPKNEAVLAYLVKVGVNNKVFHYLLIIGGEVSTKTKSMGYTQNTDSYAYHNCYCVIGAKELLQDSKFGTPKSTREVQGQVFHEYEVKERATCELIMNLLKKICTQEKVL
ncbi:hypothetical protein WDW89_25500 [Deltaproteobacteria bacterium TL4]